MIELRKISMETLDTVKLVPELKTDDHMLDLFRHPTAGEYFQHLAREWWFEGECLGFSGFHVVCPGCVEIWCALTPAARQHPKEFVEECARQCDWVTNSLLLHRMQATTRVDYHKAHNLMDRLGFEHEGTLRSYRAPGDDYILWGKLVCPA